MSDELKLGGGFLAQIEKEGNVVTYKPIDFDNPEEVKELKEKWKKFSKKEDERRKNYKPTQHAGYLLSMDDDAFKFYYNDDSVLWISGIDIYDKIEERAKKLGLI